jgi:uncharacterized membrane protein
MRFLTNWVFRNVLRYFVAGVFAILPLVVTVAVVIWVAGFLQQFVGPTAPLGRLLHAVGFNFSSDTTMAYIIGWSAVLVIIMVVGVLVEAGARGLVQRTIDALLSRVPLIGGIYGTSKQLVAMLDHKNDAQLTGMRPVFCYFGQDHGCGVLALLVSSEVFHIDGRDYLIVIVPTSPVPVGGGLFFMPFESVRTADLSVESLMSIYVSMGVNAPQFLPSAGPLEDQPSRPGGPS